jgi:hypothetical protein
MAQHTFYWSNTKFAEWIRGVAKPHALTSQGWNDWNREAKKKYPIRYWIAEEALDWLQDFVTWPIRKIYDIKYYINNRWVTRTHALTAHTRDIRPGSWMDVGNRFLPCLFNELVDFVEIEQAWHHCIWDDEAKTKFAVPWWAKGWFRIRTWRSAEAGIEYLGWASELRVDDNDPASDYTDQATGAQEIISLYHWWVDVRPLRPDPMDASGWSALCDRRRQARVEAAKAAGEDFEDDFLASLNDRSPAERAESSKILELSHQIESEQEAEDEEMMIRLIRIRRALWT